MPELDTSTPERYALIQRLVSGGMAEVYLAQDTLLSRRVVLKRVRPDLEDSAAVTTMFLEEARTVARLSHPNIVEIYDFGYQDDQPYIAMEWLEGWDLRTIAERLRKTGSGCHVGVAVRFVLEACRGLHAAHTATAEDGTPLRLVHRDVSPHNLFVNTAGTLKILDFGIAKTTAGRRQTAVGMLKGKCAYMSPEQALGAGVDSRSDLFSLGIVLHELLSGAKLFAGLEPRDCFEALCRHPIPPPSRPSEPLPEEVVRITMRALEREPSLRYQSAEALGDALAEALGNLNPQIRDQSPADYLAELFSGYSHHPEDDGPWSREPSVAFGRLDIEEQTDESGGSTVPLELPDPQALRALAHGTGLGSTAMSYGSYRRRRRRRIAGVTAIATGLAIGLAASQCLEGAGLSCADAPRSDASGVVDEDPIPIPAPTSVEDDGQAAGRPQVKKKRVRVQAGRRSRGKGRGAKRKPSGAPQPRPERRSKPNR